MLTTFLLLLSSTAAAAASAVPPLAHELDESYSFDQYLLHFDKFYDDPKEYIRRSQIFTRNLNMILNHNNGRLTENGEIIGGGYVMGVNSFTDVDVEELPMGYNKQVRASATTTHQLRGDIVLKIERRKLGGTQSYSKPPRKDLDDVTSLPTEVDWDKRGKVNLAPRQGGCGSCWTFASTAAIESHLAIVTGDDPILLSEQNILQCAPNPLHCGGLGQCTGATAELAFNYVADITATKQGGMFKIVDLPYNISKLSCDLESGNVPAAVGIDGWTKLPGNDYKAVMNALTMIGPLAIAVSADCWAYYEKGIFDSRQCKMSTINTINHAVLMVGYGVDEVTGEKYYKIRNSWGTTFGENGYIRIKRTDQDDQLCLLDTDPLVGVDCALDSNGNKAAVKPDKVCGISGVLFDLSFPVGVHYLNN